MKILPVPPYTVLVKHDAMVYTPSKKAFLEFQEETIAHMKRQLQLSKRTRRDIKAVRSPL